MYHLANDFTEDINEAATFEMETSNLYINSFDFPGPDDEDEDDESDDNNDDSAANDEEPPIDKDVVHSPVPPRTGGRG